MTPLLDTFLAESRDLVQQATEGLLALESDPRGAKAGPLVEGVFRAFHTLKGSSALFAFRPMTSVLHAAEDLLAAVLGGEVADAAPVVDVALECLDRITQWLDAIEAGDGLLPEAAAEEAVTLEASLRRALAQAGDTAPAAPAAAPAGGAPDWVAALTQADLIALRGVPREPGAAALAITYDPDPGCFLRGEDPLGLLRRLPGLAWLGLGNREPWPATEAFDPFTCYLRLRAIAFGAQPAIEQALRVTGGQARVAALPPALLGLDHGAGEDALLATILEEQVRLLRLPVAGPEQAGRIAAALRAAANALRHAGLAEASARLEARGAEAVAAGDAAALAEAIAAELPRQAAAGEAAVSAQDRLAAATRTLRVDPAQVDRLIGLADEMVVRKNALLLLLRQAETEAGLRPELAQAMRAQGAAIEGLTRGWYDVAAQLRLLPFEQVFRRFPRVVRELARDLGKPAELRLEGGATEADRDVLDRLAEPLLHLLRNSLDHGIEPPEERRRAGKPEVAVITLRAAAETDRIVLEVSDDGRGMDPARLRRRAVERGLIDAAQAAALSDAAAAELVFAPGFSTAATVSELSGRGMGMDVVRRTVEAMGGAVRLRNRPGEGTLVALSLPLGVTLTSILTVTVGGQEFGLPLRAVQRTLRVSRRHLRPLGAEGDAAFAFDDRLLPLVKLGSLLDLARPAAPPAAEGHGEARIVLIGAEGQEAALDVDAVGDRLEVVLRPLAGLLAGTEGYLGTTLLGGGQVLLVLDPDWLTR